MTVTDDASEPVLLVEDLGPVRRLTMNRGRALNALNHELLEALMRELDTAAEADSVSVIVLRGAGRAFCSGYDMNEDTEAGVLDEAAWRADLKRSTEEMLKIVDHPKPVIASVHSYCLGGGVDLMLACDLAVAADDAVFGYVDIRFGSGVVSMFLPWVVGVRAARELLYTGRDRVPADEAFRIGMVNRVVPRDRLDETTLELAREIARNEPYVVQMTKRAVNQVWEGAGFTEALAANTEIDTMIETANLPARAEFRRITQEQGLKAAIAWRDAQHHDEQA
ncbi:MAG TPA: enoyl-CoA hydratase-related protein [Actinomycetota bacterium]|nr:enoyl-CoA hydratase-related protein [Actinomycetota bacterium]